jgi:hypothetical protein
MAIIDRAVESKLRKKRRKNRAQLGGETDDNIDATNEEEETAREEIARKVTAATATQPEDSRERAPFTLFFGISHIPCGIGSCHMFNT